LNAPVGIFDSGLGGLTIWNELVKLLPREQFFYLGDSINAPYGNKSTDEIIHLSEKNTEFLLNHNSKIIIVACNTATTQAIQHLREKYKTTQFVGVEPAVKPATMNTKTNCIGILATKGTLNSPHFHDTYSRFGNDIESVMQIGEGLVKLVEENRVESEESKKLLERYIAPMLEQNADQIVLGCTHYPFFKDIIQNLVPNNVQVIDSGEAVAKHTKRILTELNALAEKSFGSDRFYTTGLKEIMIELARRLQPTRAIAFNPL
jgi:glutamate racemase